jgi:hypothetical protein
MKYTLTSKFLRAIHFRQLLLAGYFLGQSMVKCCIFLSTAHGGAKGGTKKP